MARSLPVRAKTDEDELTEIFHGPGGSETERDATYIDDSVTRCIGAVDH